MKDHKIDVQQLSELQWRLNKVFAVGDFLISIPPDEMSQPEEFIENMGNILTHEIIMCRKIIDKVENFAPEEKPST